MDSKAEESAEWGPPPVHVSERVFSRRYFRSPEEEGGWAVALCHPSGPSLLGLAPGHPALRSPLASIRLNPKLAQPDKPNSLPPQTGKKKHGAAGVRPETVLASLTGVDGRVWKLRAGMKAKLVEVNEAVLADPALLAQAHPQHFPYVAILCPQPRAKDFANFTAASLDQAAWEAEVAKELSKDSVQ